MIWKVLQGSSAHDNCTEKRLYRNQIMLPRDTVYRELLLPIPGRIQWKQLKSASE